ncbi:MAG: ABC transporter ATP-binding protein [Bryobacteraceae bacterium]
MIHARIAKGFPAGPESAAFSLDVDLKAAGGVTVLFGPSGAGKTLLLDAIAGFVKPDSGRILLDDEILFDATARVNLRPQDRHCGYVFQNYALFPHMTVRENLEFAAERRPSLDRHRRVNEMIERFRLAGVAGRRPHEVSGGEKQRASIARALISAPKLLLLDEPARGLDAPLRAELYAVLRQVRSDFRAPILLVTHDLEECFELGETMVILAAGRIIQTGAPLVLAGQPAGADVARLLGIANLYPAEVAALDPGRNTSRLKLENFELHTAYLRGRLLGDRVWVCARPHELRAAAPNGVKPGPNQVAAALLRVSERPHAVRLEFSGDITVEIAPADYARQKDNKEWLIEFPPDAIRVL